ncbi:MAG: Ku protein, partial [Pseudomonadota bacterium]|nr:Ku protein [Pseudomonadota bacterium]
DLIERKRKGATIQAEDEDKAPPRGMNVVDLMAALKRSIEKPGATTTQEEQPAPKKKATPKAAAKKPPAKKAPAKAAPAKKRAAG